MCSQCARSVPDMGCILTVDSRGYHTRARDASRERPQVTS